MIRFLTHRWITNSFSKNFSEMGDECIKSFCGWPVLMPNCFRPLERSPWQQREDKCYLGSLSWKVMRLHLQGQKTLKNKSTAVLCRTRIGCWIAHGTGSARRWRSGYLCSNRCGGAWHDECSSQRVNDQVNNIDNWQVEMENWMN